MAGRMSKDLVGVSPVRTAGPFNNRPIPGALGLDSPAAAGQTSGASPIGAVGENQALSAAGNLVVTGLVLFGIGWAVGRGWRTAQGRG